MPNPNARMTVHDGPIGDVRNALLTAAAKTLTDRRHPLAVAYVAGIALDQLRLRREVYRKE